MPKRSVDIESPPAKRAKLSVSSSTTQLNEITSSPLGHVQTLLNGGEPASETSFNTPALSSLPTDIGSMPERLQVHGSGNASQSERTGARGNGSPVRRSSRVTRTSIRRSNPEQTVHAASSTKQRLSRVSSGSSTLIASPRTKVRKLDDDTQACIHERDFVFKQSSRTSVGFTSLVDQAKVADAVNYESSAASKRVLKKTKANVEEDRVNEEYEQDTINAFSKKIHNRSNRRRSSRGPPLRWSNEQPSGLNYHDEKCVKIVYDEKGNQSSYDEQGSPIPTHNKHVKRGTTTGQTGSNNESAAPSPSTKGGRSTHAGKTVKNGRNARLTKRNGGGAPGRERESPDPPTKMSLSSEEKATLQHIRARQLELKRQFAIVAAQQREALQLMTSRDLSRVLAKPKAHTKVPEYDDVVRGLRRKQKAVESIIIREYELQVALAGQDLEARKEIAAKMFRTHCGDVQKEHIKGAEGDQVLLQKAYQDAEDETRTNNGSDIEVDAPRYHEIPESYAQPRGYSSTKIMDEKPFTAGKAAYDEQANRNVIDEDFVAPTMLSIAREHTERGLEEQKQTNLDNLLDEVGKELREDRRQAGGYLVPRVKYVNENPQFALSRLADCADLMSRGRAEPYVFTPVDAEGINSFPVRHIQHINRTKEDKHMSTKQPRYILADGSKKIAPLRQKSMSLSMKRHFKDEEVLSQASSNTSTPLQHIAPAPRRMHPPNIASQLHHHHLPQSQMPPPPPASMPPSPAHARQPNLTPLIISKPIQASPVSTPTFARSPGHSMHGPPPSPTHFRGPPFSSSPSYPPPSQPHPQSAGPSSQAFPFMRNQFLSAIDPSRRMFDRPRPPQSPSNASATDTHSQHHPNRIPISVAPARARIGGPRREPGQITFTPAQTPQSERFKAPQQPSPLPPGQAMYRPSSLQPRRSLDLTASAGASPNAGPEADGTGSPGPETGAGAGQGGIKVGNTFVNIAPDANTRAQQAADVAKQNASRNQVQGAGPRGGRRVLLPKLY